MNLQAREFRYFLYSQAFADGLRTTVAVLLPALVGSFYGQFETGMTLSLGALCVSLTDAPGPLLNKRNGMLLCTVALFLVATLTAFARQHPVTMGLELVGAGFFFSMFNAYGPRAAAVGNAVLLIVILTMDNPLPPGGVWVHSGLIAAGGLWYFALSYFFSLALPYRPGQRVLGECIRELARYLHIKASFYDPSSDLDSGYRQLVSRQVLVHEKQDAVRDILFKTRQITQESTLEGRRLILMFVETVDLFEDITAAYYDYASLRRRFAPTGILEQIAEQIREMARHLDDIGVAVQMDRPYRADGTLEAALTRLKSAIDALPKLPSESHLVLRKILVNLRRLSGRLTELEHFFDPETIPERKSRLDHGLFVSHQPLDPKIFWSNLTPESVVFRHSLRVAFACLFGYFLTRLINYGEHSYWVLLTIAFILKPAFSLTRERNVQRIIGTLGGGLFGVAVLYFIPSREAQFVIMVLCMLGTYSFLRINYLAMVCFTTPFMLILFHFLGMPFIELAQERIFDTVLGCAIAFGTSVLLLPSWEADQLGGHLKGLLRANGNYLDLIISALEGRKVSQLSYKLARKELYVQTANLSAAFQRMLNEPRNLQRSKKHLHPFIVLQHILFSNMATLATDLLRREPRAHAPALVHSAQKALRTLEGGLERMHAEKEAVLKEVESVPGVETAPAAEDALMKEQLDYINQVCTDMDKALRQIGL
ncbi:FUSC family membrane protein [Flaviaesturariibacter amylovorans]|uniref:FUSC family protein n=1 Tax=Flaviaesturariibacter amylovorans TaxID=1084520 RepID=A0ABP8GHE8_9BACT